MLLDCGTTVLLGLQQQNIDPAGIDAILLSHLHGDHFGGVPFFLIHAQFVLKRQKKLTILGPQGTRQRIMAAIDVLFPDLIDTVWSFPLDVIEIEAGRDESLGDLTISSFLVDHPSGAPSFAFRLACEDKVVAFSGDTCWTEALIDIADGADLLIAECQAYRPNGLHHLDWQTLNARKDDLRAERVLITHMGDSMLSRLEELDRGRFEFVEDGFATAI